MKARRSGNPKIWPRSHEILPFSYDDKFDSMRKNMEGKAMADATINLLMLEEWNFDHPDGTTIRYRKGVVYYHVPTDRAELAIDTGRAVEHHEGVAQDRRAPDVGGLDPEVD